ncbi:hypothetical protein LTR05_006568 [Lithohypha guttulata]|uniref:Aminotransferase class I/classII large domain-containing protein n=1 Tax=Lithohypha guttulata TaxID=1690604 RepID=A0AAN7YEF3_9EURO|nr:hypothetical protein LTR05_006568 [Lithohypha guttulata]
MPRNSLEQSLAATLERRRRSSKLRTLKSSSPDAIDFSSNDFLSLSTTQEFRKDYLKELESHALPVGSTGSRLLDGNSQYAEDLERRIADFHRAETALLVGSGFDANVSIFTCLPQPGDIVVYDELIHASVHDGMKVSRAVSFLPFKHNCLVDFRSRLSSCRSGILGKNIFVAVETVYSMDGDLAPLVEMLAIMKELFPQGNCHLIVDEAHSTGIYGPKGKGRVSELGLEGDVLVRLHTFGKGLACNGAVILSSHVIRSYLINYARPIIFTTFMSYPMLVAVKVAYDWLSDGKTESLSMRLFHLIRYMYSGLKRLEPLTQNLEPGSMLLPGRCPESAIFALMMREPRELAGFCQANGFIVRPVVHPTVPQGTERVRICLHAGNTEAEIDAFVDKVQTWLKYKTSLLSELSSQEGVRNTTSLTEVYSADIQQDPAAILAKL